MKKSVLAFEHCSDIAGGQVVFFQILKELQQLELEVGVVVPHAGKLISRLEAKAFSEIKKYTYREFKLSSGSKSLGDYLSFCFSWSRLVRYWVNFRKYDIFYVNGGRILLAAAIPAFLFRKKVIYHAHVCHSPLEKAFLTFLVRIGVLNRVVVPSDFVKIDLQRFSHTFKSDNKIVLIDNCLSDSFCSLKFINRFSPGTGSIKDIAVFGKVAHHKGHDVIVELAREYPSLCFHFVGGKLPGSEVFYEMLAERAPNNVVFWGAVESISDFICSHQIQISIVPSRWSEPFGLVAIESMACSCLTISSGRGGLEQISKNTSMLCFNLDDRDSLGRLIDSLLCEDGKALTNAARLQYLRTQHIYSKEVFSEKLLKLIRDL